MPSIRMKFKPKADPRPWPPPKDPIRDMTIREAYDILRGHIFYDVSDGMRMAMRSRAWEIISDHENQIRYDEETRLNQREQIREASRYRAAQAQDHRVRWLAKPRKESVRGVKKKVAIRDHLGDEVFVDAWFFDDEPGEDFLLS